MDQTLYFLKHRSMFARVQPGADDPTRTHQKLAPVKVRKPVGTQKRRWIHGGALSGGYGIIESLCSVYQSFSFKPYCGIFSKQDFRKLHECPPPPARGGAQAEDRRDSKARLCNENQRLLVCFENTWKERKNNAS